MLAAAAMMRRKRAGGGPRARPSPVQGSEEESGFGMIIACYGCIMGICLITIGRSRASECKMRAIDASTFRDEEKLGNLVKWMIYTGSIYTFTGCSICCILGPGAKGCREHWPCLGTILYGILTGLFGKLLLVFMFILAFICNVIGYFWLYMASLSRNEYNSGSPGTPNYCAPDVWYTAQIAVNIFWALSAIIIIRGGAKIHAVLRGSEARLEKIEIGVNKEDGTKDVIVLPKKREGAERHGKALPKK